MKEIIPKGDIQSYVLDRMDRFENVLEEVQRLLRTNNSDPGPWEFFIKLKGTPQGVQSVFDELKRYELKAKLTIFETRGGDFSIGVDTPNFI